MNTKIKIMKKIKLLHIILFCMILLSASHCEKHEPTALPPETQTGANTLGCYVDGKLFVAQREYGPFGGTYLSAGYSRYNKLLGIAAYGKNGNTGFSLFNPEEKIKIFIFAAGYQQEDRLYGKNPIGEIYLTKFDTINNVVSGTFFYKITKYDNDWNNNDSIVNITQGRFDIKLDITDL